MHKLILLVAIITAGCTSINPLDLPSNETLIVNDLVYGSDTLFTCQLKVFDGEYKLYGKDEFGNSCYGPALMYKQGSDCSSEVHSAYICKDNAELYINIEGYIYRNPKS